MATTKVRILVDTVVDGKAYRCNQVVELEAGKAKALVKAGVACDAAESVKYVTETLKAKVVKHDEPQAGEGNPSDPDNNGGDDKKPE